MKIIQGDITDLPFKVGAIVNSAHPTLGVGGGVCGAIHEAAGPGLAMECLRFMRNSGKSEIDTASQAVVTLPWGMADKADILVHVVAPALQGVAQRKKWRGRSLRKETAFVPSSLDTALLETAYRSAAIAAYRDGAESIAFPLLGAGSYCWPVKEAYTIATNVLTEIYSKWGLETYLVLYPGTLDEDPE